MADQGDFTNIAEGEGAILDKLANLLGKHKLVPFFGAGISRRQLGFAAAGLAAQMAPLVEKSSETLLSELTDDFIDKLGEEAFLDFLKEKLVLSDFDDAKVSTHRLLVSLSLSLLYTTNQDNLFELVAKKYGRSYRRVVTVADLSESDPGEPLLIKFHGDMDEPASLVFGKRSYEQRIKSTDNPLDIRLRADLLGKQLLFIGYSLQDENVSKLMKVVRGACAGQLPPSYLLAFEYDPSMELLTQEYGVRIIDPLRLCPTAETNADAFERCLKSLCDRTIKVQARRGLDQLFGNDQVNRRMVTDFEIEAISKVVDTEPFNVALPAFRGIFDLAVVPTHQNQPTAAIFDRLCLRADPTCDEEMSALKGALFNIRLPGPQAVQMMASVMASCNGRPPREGSFDEFMALMCPALPDHARPVAAAVAISMLCQRGETITDNFRSLAQTWLQGWQDIEPNLLERVKQATALAWPGHLASDSPLNRPRFPFQAKGFHEIYANLMAQFPKRFRRPATG